MWIQVRSNRHRTINHHYSSPRASFAFFPVSAVSSRTAAVAVDDAAGAFSSRFRFFASSSSPSFWSAAGADALTGVAAGFFF